MATIFWCGYIRRALPAIFSPAFAAIVVTSCRMALERISKEGRGNLLYIEQEGRGIGLVNKIRAYELQDRGADTVEANIQLGFKPDLRDYGLGAQVLVNLGVKRMRLMTNNPAKRAGIEGYGLEIVERIPLVITPNENNHRYLATKQAKMGHIYDEQDAAYASSVIPTAAKNERSGGNT